MASVPGRPQVSSSDTVQHENSNLKEKLIDAAEICFEKKGVAHTSMLDVAAEAGVSRTSLYKHYPRIDDVLKAAFVREFDRFEENLADKLAHCKNAEERLVETVIGLAENVPKSSWIGSLVSGPRTKTEETALHVGRSALNARIRSLIDEPLTALFREGKLRDDVDRRQVIEWTRIQVHAFSVFRHPGGYTKQKRRELISSFLLRAILA
jgi:AcrR family transcriptional regulator